MSLSGEDGFDWAGDSSIVVREQKSVAVYVNDAGGIVIREQRSWDDEADCFIVIQPEYARGVAAALLREAGIVTPPKDATARDRQRRHRDKERDGHANVTPIRPAAE